jgi:hypothetical protein
MSTQTESAQATTSPTREWQWGWGIVLLANLPMPLLFGLFVVSNSGQLGMLAGVAVVWFAGHLHVGRSAVLRGPLLLGGGCVALSQIFPLLHIGAGTLSVETLGNDRELAPGLAFVATLLTAAQLLAVALVCGFFLRWAGLLADRLLVRLEQGTAGSAETPSDSEPRH